MCIHNKSPSWPFPKLVMYAVRSNIFKNKNAVFASTSLQRDVNCCHVSMINAFKVYDSKNLMQGDNHNTDAAVLTVVVACDDLICRGVPPCVMIWWDIWTFGDCWLDERFCIWMGTCWLPNSCPKCRLDWLLLEDTCEDCELCWLVNIWDESCWLATCCVFTTLTCCWGCRLLAARSCWTIVESTGSVMSPWGALRIDWLDPAVCK